MTPEFLQASLRDLLDEAPPAERERLAARLAADPAAAEEYRALAEALAGHIAAESAPGSAEATAPVIDWREVEGRVGRRSPPRPAPWDTSLWRWGWPAAAAILFGLQIFSRHPRNSAAVPASSPAPLAPLAPHAASATGAMAAAPPLPGPLPGAQHLIAIELLAPVLAQAGAGRPGETSPTPIRLAREPGPAQPSPSLSLAPGLTATVSHNHSVAILSAESTSLSFSFQPPPSARGGASALNVYDDTAHRGYLAVYNLPAVRPGNVLVLWARPAGGSFAPVGPVPAQLYGRTGSLVYQLPAGARTPAEILVTEEPRSPAPAAPSGKTILRGP